MSYPDTYTSKNETGCCAIPDVSQWDEKEIIFENVQFIRMYTRSFLHIPLNMGKVMNALQKTAEDADVTMPTTKALILSREISPWKAEQLYAVTKPVENADNVMLSGTFMTKVFEGPFQKAKEWYDTLITFVKNTQKEVQHVYFFYTTCPKCAKHYGKNYVIGLAKI